MLAPGWTCTSAAVPSFSMRDGHKYKVPAVITTSIYSLGSNHCSIDTAITSHTAFHPARKVEWEKGGFASYVQILDKRQDLNSFQSVSRNHSRE